MPGGKRKPSKKRVLQATVEEDMPKQHVPYTANFLRPNTTWVSLFDDKLKKEVKQKKEVMLQELVQERALKQQELVELDKVYELDGPLTRAQQDDDALTLYHDMIKTLTDIQEVMKTTQIEQRKASKIAEELNQELPKLTARVDRLEFFLSTHFPGKKLDHEEVNINSFEMS
ncbi:MAG: hypothetical protein K0U37_03330 [Gammaproteobacteria bacterium]|nr:hypothetical protein [Gammaproteobacteria bacterium]